MPHPGDESYSAAVQAVRDHGGEIEGEINRISALGPGHGAEAQASLLLGTLAESPNEAASCLLTAPQGDQIKDFPEPSSQAVGKRLRGAVATLVARRVGTGGAEGKSRTVVKLLNEKAKSLARYSRVVEVLANLYHQTGAQDTPVEAFAAVMVQLRTQLRKQLPTATGLAAFASGECVGPGAFLKLTFEALREELGPHFEPVAMAQMLLRETNRHAKVGFEITNVTSGEELETEWDGFIIKNKQHGDGEFDDENYLDR